MKKVVDGKVYDTSTASLIAEWSNGCGYSDFNYCEEALYLTKKGVYFLHGEGGALSSYRQSVGSNSWSEGSAIVPLSEQEACLWCEEHDVDADIIAAHFKVEEA